MLSVRMLKEWRYDFVDHNGDVATRICPKGLVLEFDDDVCADAVATDHAETLRPHTPAFAELVLQRRRYFDILHEVGDPAEATRILAEELEARAVADAESARVRSKAAKAKAQADSDAAKAKAEADAKSSGKKRS